MAASVGVNLGIEDHDIYVFARCQHMVNAAVTNIVGPAIAAEDPVGAFYKVLLHFIESSTGRALILMGGNCCFQSIGALTRALAIILACQPCFHSSLQISRNILSQGFVDNISNLSAVLSNANVHA